MGCAANTRRKDVKNVFDPGKESRIMLPNTVCALASPSFNPGGLKVTCMKQHNCQMHFGESCAALTLAVEVHVLMKSGTFVVVAYSAVCLRLFVYLFPKTL